MGGNVHIDCSNRTRTDDNGKTVAMSDVLAQELCLADCDSARASVCSGKNDQCSDITNEQAQAWMRTTDDKQIQSLTLCTPQPQSSIPHF